MEIETMPKICMSMRAEGRAASGMEIENAASSAELREMEDNGGIGTAEDQDSADSHPRTGESVDGDGKCHGFGAIPTHENGAAL